MQAMIFAAGLGTRLRPITDSKPKALVEINGKTLLERNVEKLVSYGIKHIIINVHHFADMLTKYILGLQKKYSCELIVSDEKELLLNTGGGLLYAKDLFLPNEPILLHNVDILSDLDFSAFEKTFLSSHPLALLAVQQRETQRYFIFNNQKQLCGWTNLFTNERIITRSCKEEFLFAFSGIHIISPEIFAYITQRGVFSITDTYIELSKKYPILAYPHTGSWIDVGKPSAILKAQEVSKN